MYKMNVLVVGGGGREHALVWKIKQSPRVGEVFCAPGNAGIAGLATCVDIKADDLEGLLRFADERKIDLTVVGPEVPLAAGIVDKFNEAGKRIFGPGKKAAAIEGSKIVAKELMDKYGIPTAPYAMFDNAEKAEAYIREHDGPCVVKADGLAAGKGVIVCEDADEALEAVRTIMRERTFGEAGNKIIIEERLIGEEVSVLAFTDGKTVVPMVSSQDHKQVYDGDQGPNTGGMGAYAPAPVYSEELHKIAMEKVMLPAVRGMAAEGRTYKGVLYAGLMVTDKGPKVLEFNARFGDPEAQPVFTLLKSDLVEIMEAIISEKLHEIEIEWEKAASVCVVLASGGYPGSYQKGAPISGLDQANAREGVVVFHAGTADKDGKIVTGGGRVLGVTAKAPDIRSAITKAYEAVELITFKDMHYRRDIGQKALDR